MTSEMMQKGRSSGSSPAPFSVHSLMLLLIGVVAVMSCHPYEETNIIFISSRAFRHCSTTPEVISQLHRASKSDLLSLPIYQLVLDYFLFKNCMCTIHSHYIPLKDGDYLLNVMLWNMFRLLKEFSTPGDLLLDPL